MEKVAYQKLLVSLSQNAATKTLDNGAKVEIRSCFDREPGKMDPRTSLASRATREDFMQHPERYDSELLANADRLFGPPAPENYSQLSLIRYTFGWRSTDLSKNIIKERHILTTGHGPFPVWRYEAPGIKEARPCIIFIHGGAFVAGDIETVENQCKLLAQLMDGVVFSIDYPLAPEHKYPVAFNDCKAALDWVCSNADTFGIDRKRIGVAGDSAGGNLSAALSIADRDEGTHKISYQCLIYPKLSSAVSLKEPHYYWSREIYDNADNDPIINEQLFTTGKMSEAVDRWYLSEDADRRTPYYCPIAAKCEGLPKTLIITAEYDFLRAECDAYLGMLKTAGVDFRAIRYGGIFHGTFDRLGYAPQVEDILQEIAKDMCPAK
ncbi:MAG TPA: alpha/beta hydrolase [Caproiciproducens sp.]|nr:alpha/beta hydrolase [Caproiciproducens sp.]